MKKLTLTNSILMMIVILVSCGKADTTDPMKLYSQLDPKAAPNTLSAKEKRNGWKLLFDGKITDGWRGYNMKVFPESWAIEDGCLTMNTTGGAESQDIININKYKSFALSVEYKLTKGANSGVIYQIAEDTIYKFPYETGPEVQVIDHEGWQGPEKLEEWQINGANYAMYPPMVKPYKPVGEWNHLMIVVNGNNVTQILNDSIIVKYVKYSDEWNKLRNSGKWVNFPDWGKFDEGYFSLQNHGTKVWYRNIKLKEL